MENIDYNKFWADKDSKNPNKTGIRKCTKCGLEKHISEFYKSNSSKYGLSSHCKRCANEYAKAAQKEWRNIKVPKMVHSEVKAIADSMNITMVDLIKQVVRKIKPNTDV